jgi:ABC-type transport system involved in cytochrome c biogenesis permease component
VSTIVKTAKTNFSGTLSDLSWGMGSSLMSCWTASEKHRFLLRIRVLLAPVFSLSRLFTADEDTCRIDAVLSGNCQYLSLGLSLHCWEEVGVLLLVLQHLCYLLRRLLRFTLPQTFPAQ